MGGKRGCADCGKSEVPAGSSAAVAEPPTERKLDERIFAMRLQICQACEEAVKDEQGQATARRLPGAYRETFFCGNPNDARTQFNPERFGLGKDMPVYARQVDALCPRGKWGPGDSFTGGVIPLFVTGEDAEKVEEGVLDYIGPTRARDTNLTDCTGIGDTMIQSVVCQALRRHRPEHRVRFVTLSGRTEWAKFGNPGGEVDALDRKNRIPGEHAMHSAAMLAVEIDATARMRGYCRQQVLAEMAGLSEGSVSEWKYEIPDAPREVAKEFLAHPLREERPIIALAPQCHAFSRQWPIRHWVHLGDLLKREGAAVFVLAEPLQPGEAHWLKGIPFRRFSSHDPYAIAAILKMSDVLITNDSGMGHVAGFVGTKAVAICGPTDGQVAFGGWPSVRSLQAPGPCSGCLWFQDGGWKPWCSYGCGALQELKPQVVRASAMDHMS